MRIEISQEDINKGKQSDPEKCPIARAINRKKLRDVSVYSDSITWRDQKNDLCEQDNTNKIRKFIDNFDHGIKVSPFSFNLRS